MAEPSPKHPDKFARYRDRKRAQGMKLLRLWTPDPSAPGFQDRLDRQLREARETEDERQVMTWIAAVTADVPLDPYEETGEDAEPTNSSR